MPYASDRILLIYNGRLSACAAAFALPQKAVPAPAAADPHPKLPSPGPPRPTALCGSAIWNGEQVDFSSAEAFTQAIGTMLDNIQSIGATVVLAQVRPFGDALYPSDYFPFSHLCTRHAGAGPRV